MTTSYAVDLTDSGTIIFSGLFSVNSSNEVTQFYQTFPVPTVNNNILLPPGTLRWNSFSGTPYNDNIYTGGQYFTLNGTAVTTTNFVVNGNDITSMTLAYSTAPFLSTRLGQCNYADGLGYGSLAISRFNYTIASYNPSCYNEGTKILCLNKQLAEEYIAIELLRKGDLVKSYKHGYRRVDLIGRDSMINNPNRFNQCMYKMEKTAENGLLEDLIVTGGHVLLVDDLGDHKEKNDKIFGATPMIDDKYLLLSAVSNDFKKIENNNLYTYYHFTLENNGSDDERFGVWANGILTETVSKNQFSNHKYTLL